MDLQTILALLVVLGAVAWVGRRLWRTLRPAVRPSSGGGGDCGSGCGCGH
jgi:hypothetical protein